MVTKTTLQESLEAIHEYQNPRAYGNIVNKTADFTVTIADVTNGTTFMIDTTAGDVEITLPAASGLPSDSVIYSLNIHHNAGANKVKLIHDSSSTFIYGNTYFDLGSQVFAFIVAGYNTGSSANFGLMKGVVIEASIHRDVSWSASNFSSNTAIPFDTQDYNTQDELIVWDSGTNPSRVTVLTPGRYKVSGSINLDSTGGSTWNATAMLRVNGTTDLDSTEIRTGNYGNEDQSMSFPPTYIDLEGGDYIEFMIDQNSLTGNMVHAILNIELQL